MLFSKPTLNRRNRSQFVGQTSALESRQLLAGNVTAAFSGVDLVITGDNSANAVQVLYNGVDVLVRGLNGTKVNGSAADFLAVAASDTLPGDLAFNLGRGNDFARVSNFVKVTGDLQVAPGAGNDVTVIQDATITGELGVGGFSLSPSNDDAGDDNVAIIDTMAGSMSVLTGSGNDVVMLATVVANDILVSLGTGDDVLQAQSTVEATDNLIVGAGAGNDFVIGGFKAGGFTMDLDAGNDLLFFGIDQTDAARSAIINLGTGNDKAIAVSVSVVSLLSINGSKGLDQFFLAPGYTATGGVLFQEVESNSPFDINKGVSASFIASGKRLGRFVDFVMTLP